MVPGVFAMTSLHATSYHDHKSWLLCLGQLLPTINMCDAEIGGFGQDALYQLVDVSYCRCSCLI